MRANNALRRFRRDVFFLNRARTDERDQGNEQSRQPDGYLDLRHTVRHGEIDTPRAHERLQPCHPEDEPRAGRHEYQHGRSDFQYAKEHVADTEGLEDLGRGLHIGRVLSRSWRHVSSTRRRTGRSSCVFSVFAGHGRGELANGGHLMGRLDILQTFAKISDGPQNDQDTGQYSHHRLRRFELLNSRRIPHLLAKQSAPSTLSAHTTSHSRLISCAPKPARPRKARPEGAEQREFCVGLADWVPRGALRPERPQVRVLVRQTLPHRRDDR